MHESKVLFVKSLFVKYKGLLVVSLNTKVYSLNTSGLFVFDDTIEGFRAPAVKLGRVTPAGRERVASLSRVSIDEGE